MTVVAGSPGIGLLRERHLHASLKRWYAAPGAGVIEAVGKRGHAVEYRLAAQE